MRTIKFSLALLMMLVALLVSGCGDDNSAASSGGLSGSNGSLGDTQPTGKISANGFYMLFDPVAPKVFDSKLKYTQTEVTITVYAEDVNDLVELNGNSVNFRVEWGAFLEEGDSCDLSNGSCSVTWRSGDPANAPTSCEVAITAWTFGEESFIDFNDNNLFDWGETFTDQEEPFLDIDSNNVFTSEITTAEGVSELIDIVDFLGSGGKNGRHDSGNGKYDGSLCAENNSNSCSGRKSQIIHTRAKLFIQEPFTDSDDVNKNEDTVEVIRFCGKTGF